KGPIREQTRRTPSRALFVCSRAALARGGQAAISRGAARQSGARGGVLAGGAAATARAGRGDLAGGGAAVGRGRAAGPAGRPGRDGRRGPRGAARRPRASRPARPPAPPPLPAPLTFATTPPRDAP